MTKEDEWDRFQSKENSDMPTRWNIIYELVKFDSNTGRKSAS